METISPRQVYVPHEINYLLFAQPNIEQVFDPPPDSLHHIEQGNVVSPMGIRLLTQAVCAGVETELGRLRIYNPIRALNRALWARIMGYVSEEEYQGLKQQRPLKRGLPTCEADLWMPLTEHRYLPSPDTRVVASRRACIELVHRKIEANPNLSVILFKGNFRVMHPGYLAGINDAFNFALGYMQLELENILLVVACDVNRSIEAQGRSAILTTAWRMSQMALSPIPVPMIVWPSGDTQPDEDLNKYWTDFYRAVGPERLLVIVEPESELYDTKRICIEKTGAVVIELSRRRFGPLNFEVSSTGILEETVGDTTLESLYGIARGQYFLYDVNYG